MSEDIPYALIRWIKAQQEKEEAHKRDRAIRNFKEDKEYYIKYISELVGNWNKLRVKEKEILSNLMRQHQEHRNFTGPQRSLITGLYMKHCLK